MQHTRVHLEQTESTNDVGGQWLKTATPGEILTVWTSNQTQGRGQRGNAWEQSPGLDLALTVAVKWPANATPRDPVATNKAVTVRIRHAISGLLTNSSGIRAIGIKWPNDILVQNTAKRWLKCAGILIENTWRGTTWDGMLIGVGVNVNSVHSGANRRCALGEFASSTHVGTGRSLHIGTHSGRLGCPMLTHGLPNAPRRIRPAEALQRSWSIRHGDGHRRKCHRCLGDGMDAGRRPLKRGDH